MNIQYQKNLDDVSWERIIELFQTVGWGARTLKEIEASFTKSSHVVIVKDNSKIIAFGRTVDDGKYYALIADLVVDPDYQGRGIGKLILEELRNELKDYSFTTLTAAPEKDDFYIKQGWKRQTSAFIWPRSTKQENEHTRGS